MRSRTYQSNGLSNTARLNPDFNKAIHIDIWISRPGAYAYRIEYEPLPEWDPLEKTNGSREIKAVGHTETRC